MSVAGKFTRIAGSEDEGGTGGVNGRGRENAADAECARDVDGLAGDSEGLSHEVDMDGICVESAKSKHA